MTQYSILIFDEGVSPKSIFEKFSERELAHLAFSANGKGGIAGAVNYLSKINDNHSIQTFLITSVRKQAEQLEYEQRVFAEAVRDTVLALNQSLKLSEVLDCILSKLELVVPFDAINIMLVDNGVARIAACRGYEKLGGAERVMKQARVIKDVPNLATMMETGKPIVVPDTKESPDWVEFDSSTWIHSYVSVPIVHKDRTIGFLNLNSATPNLYNEKMAERLLVFANQTAIAIQNARLFEKAQREIVERKRAEAALQETMNELEARVQQRTAQLSAMNEQLKLELERRKQVEEALEKERALLAQRVQERTAELSATNAELAKAVRLKDTFLANMSHELRTPLNAILNISENLQEQVFGDLNEAQSRSIKTIEDSGRDLLALINDILDLSKIGAGKFDINLDSVPVRDVCYASLKVIEAAARKKQLTVTSTFDPAVKTIWADQRRLKQVLLNLLSNAVKFTPAGGTIGLKVSGDRAKNIVQFTVWDSGIGIPEESLSSLFKPFVQLDSSLARQYEGTGLGLALVYHIVELHNGGVRVESTPGKGSEFIITLNWDGDLEADGLPRMFLNDLSLVEGDQSDYLFQANRLLQEMGVETKTFWFEDGILPKFGHLTPDFLVLNDRLAKRGVVRQLRQWPATQNIPVLVVGKEPPESLEDLPGKTQWLRIPLSRQHVRTAIRALSPSGTASLIHNAVVLMETAAVLAENRQTILVADEHENGNQAVCDYLMAKGYRLLHAYNGVETIERAREGCADAILLNIQMPGMDGFEVIRKIRADERTRRYPVFAFTALALPKDRERCLAAGANEYLSKPLSPKQLAKMIDEHLQPQIELPHPA